MPETFLARAAAGLWTLAAIILHSAASAAVAPDLDAGLDWDYCGKRPARLGPASPAPPPDRATPVTIEADDFVYDQDREQLQMVGRIALDQGSRHLTCDRLLYDLKTEQVTAIGQVFVAQPRVRLSGRAAQFDFRTNTGRIEHPEYRFSGPLNARGTAALAELLDEGQSRYADLLYSTCRPGQEDWSLKARHPEIDEKKGWGIARHARLRFGGVPVFYTPYLSFPIDDRRKSGLLVPSTGSSSGSGFELITPYYFNLAPNFDATVSPRYLEKRGLLLGAEFRFLTPQYSGEFYGEAITKDQSYQDDSARGAVRLRYGGHHGGGWSSYLAFDEVSDTSYLEDYGNRLEFTSLRYLERLATLDYTGTRWRASLRVKDFQTVDASIAPENRPYALLPQLALTLEPYRLASGLEWALDAEFDAFDHAAKVHGQRLALQPSLSWPLRRPYGYLIPRVNLYGAAYHLEGTEAGDPDNPSYVLPSVNLDGKLVFERPLQWLGREARQTLEPRLFYLYTAFQDQDDIPVFDSAALSFSYNSLFRANRFTGRDRIGDANQLTLGLTSRTLERASGREWFRLSLGQILYFQDRRVQIDEAPSVQERSAVAGEVAARLLENLSGRASFQWDPEAEEESARKRVLEFHYETPDNRLVNLAYRFDFGSSEDTRYEDLDLSLRWSLPAGFDLVGRWYYSLLNSQTTEAFAGVEFGRCCWKVRVLGRHLKNKPDTDGENSIMVQLELAGLGHFGHSIDTFLEQGIYGYHAR